MIAKRQLPAPNDRLHSDNPMVLQVTQAPRVHHGDPFESSHDPQDSIPGQVHLNTVSSAIA